jgi:hypothetical protein
MVPESYERTLWYKFSEAFVKELNAADTPSLVSFCSNPIPRTEFYEGMIPRVGDALNLGYNRQERLAIDHTLFDCKTFAPLVFIEVENNPSSIGKPFQEIWRLCSLSAPLRIIITHVTRWPEVNNRSKLMKKWGPIIAERHRLWPNCGLLVAIISELQSWDTKLAFYAHSCIPDTGDWQDEGLNGGGMLLERDLSTVTP